MAMEVEPLAEALAVEALVGHITVEDDSSSNVVWEWDASLDVEWDASTTAHWS